MQARIYFSTREMAYIQRNMSRKGNCWDNAVAKSFSKRWQKDICDKIFNTLPFEEKHTSRLLASKILTVKKLKEFGMKSAEVRAKKNTMKNVNFWPKEFFLTEADGSKTSVEVSRSLDFNETHEINYFSFMRYRYSITIYWLKTSSSRDHWRFHMVTSRDLEFDREKVISDQQIEELGVQIQAFFEGLGFKKGDSIYSHKYFFFKEDPIAIYDVCLSKAVIQYPSGIKDKPYSYALLNLEELVRYPSN